MLRLAYSKRKNTELFKQLEQPEALQVRQLQNYLPFYQRFFSLNATNWNLVNLNHPWHLAQVRMDAAGSTESSSNNNNNNSGNPAHHILQATLRNEEGTKRKARVFFKLAPLVDPFRYLVGKADNCIELPQWSATPSEELTKLRDPQNAAYVDSFFVFLSSQLLHQAEFPHGVDFYGSFLGIKQQFQVDVLDDLVHLASAPFFLENHGKLFVLEDDALFKELQEEAAAARRPPPLCIGDEAEDVLLSVQAEELGDVVEDSAAQPMEEVVEQMEEMSLATEDPDPVPDNVVVRSRASSSTCSSRSSHTEEELGAEEALEGEEMEEEHAEGQEYEDVDEDGEEEEYEDVDEDEVEEDERLMLTIPEFPVQVICMEQCHNTLDNLILDTDDLSDDEWFAMLMQIILMLLTYQKAFDFTHNDLHSNNVMYVETKTEYLWYRVNGTVYRVPTYGRLFKIIDYGRAIYRYHGQTFCSNSFAPDGDAYSQYNCEPFFNPKKPRLEPNPSFDLCRLACSLLDFVVDEFTVLQCRTPQDLLDMENPVGALIYDWCCDDKGHNMVYKHNGQDRYPNFKLYKMIARTVHRHTPQAQLSRREFKQFAVHSQVPAHVKVFDVDALPSFV